MNATNEKKNISIDYDFTKSSTLIITKNGRKNEMEFDSVLDAQVFLTDLLK